ncbi:hypothetical protein WJX81_006759 [Elliptochloris bilobata]|uniref:Sugar phosphate transporter domain-containing protein n=1 Tax=Elliptochloris bilobata TaxID=381761 RepID=A0AAW1RM78_9CHLO
MDSKRLRGVEITQLEGLDSNYFAEMNATAVQRSSGSVAEAIEALASNLGVAPQTLAQGLGMSGIALAALVFVCLAKARSSQSAAAKRIFAVTVLVLCYSLCSSMLLILNKVAVTYVPAPSFILALQLLSCAAFVRTLSAVGAVEAEPLTLHKARPFAVIVLGFIGTLYANITSLKYVPVDTIICFRASMPLVIAVIEWLYMGRELPSLRSWASMLSVLAGVAVYTAADVHFTVLGYAWVAIWYAFGVFEMVYVKRVVDSVPMTTWSRTYYQNALAVLPMAAITLAGGEVGVLRTQFWSLPAVAVLMLACVAGLGMSYFSFALRAVISATSFSVIGNVCKVLTILVNLLMWDNHANVWGTCALLACLAAGSAYQQPPMRAASPPTKGAAAAPLLQADSIPTPKLSPLKLAEEGMGPPQRSLPISSPARNGAARNGHKEAQS